ncbi:MAG: nitrous oxide reductase accessory protein NosL [Desulfobacterales bacterium]|nr:nitrous oxide reductase accessory protein NosL [Desulfobacterales bacterium]MDJ0885807.1 nitrous oxide reductase accessory protein NosL [Desulfobacterales bacterium]
MPASHKTEFNAQSRKRPMPSLQRRHCNRMSKHGHGARICAAILIGTVVMVAAAWGQSPRPGKTPLDNQNRMHISRSDRCPVCAMRPAKYPRFAAAIRLQDGTTFYFCSAGCMLKAWLRPDVFLGVRAEDRRQPVAQDYFSGQPLDARHAYWVSGADVLGPMGPALIPLHRSAHVDAFRRRHGGTRVFRLEDLDEDNWKKLTGKPFRF